MKHMRFYFKKQFKVLPRNALRSCGYKPWRDQRGREAYIKRLTKDFYPRFHIIYIEDSQGRPILDLHLDYKRPVHARVARTYETESEVVKREAERIKKILEIT